MWRGLLPSGRCVKNGGEIPEGAGRGIGLMSLSRKTGQVLGTSIDALSWDAALARLLGWAHARESRYVTICNVHVVVSASRDAAYREIINGSDMATPDGAPVAWMLRKLGFANQPRVSGPDLMWALCESVAMPGK